MTPEPDWTGPQSADGTSSTPLGMMRFLSFPVLLNPTSETLAPPLPLLLRSQYPHTKTLLTSLLRIKKRIQFLLPIFQALSSSFFSSASSSSPSFGLPLLPRDYIFGAVQQPHRHRQGQVAGFRWRLLLMLCNFGQVLNQNSLLLFLHPSPSVCPSIYLVGGIVLFLRDMDEFRFLCQ